MAETFNVKLGLDADSASVKATADTISKNLQKYLDERLSSNLHFRSMSQVFAQSLNYALEESVKKVNFNGSLDNLYNEYKKLIKDINTLL